MAIYWLKERGTQMAGGLTTNWQAGMSINWQAGSRNQMTGQELRTTDRAWMAIYWL